MKTLKFNLAVMSFLRVPIVNESCLHSGPETSLLRSSFNLDKLYFLSHLIKININIEIIFDTSCLTKIKLYIFGG